MKGTRKIASCLAVGTLFACLGAQAQAASPAPAWRLNVYPIPTNFQPGGEAEIFLAATNVGAAATTEPIVYGATLPTGLTPTEVDGVDSDPESADPLCSIAAQSVTCETPGPLHPGRWLAASIHFEVDPLAPPQLLFEASTSGGGAPPVSASAPIEVGSESPSFGFIEGLAGLGAVLANADGSPATQAGSHPDQLTVNVGFPTERVEHSGASDVISAGHLHDLRTELPPGVVVNPTSTPVLCTEAELSNESGCPAASQVGVVNVLTGIGAPVYSAGDPLFNMVPPPGVPAQLGFEPLGIGVSVHIDGSVRSDGDYGLSAEVRGTPALPGNPVFGAQVQLWGDPSSPNHDQIRTIKCRKNGGSCPVEPQKAALLTMPSHCGEPPEFAAAADSWEEPGIFVERSAPTTDLQGDPVGVDGCNQLPFKPTIEARPTTNLSDSPSGLDFELHQPQDTDKEHISPANLKDATVTLPEGMAVNPASANGQGACSSAQIGLKTAIGQRPIHLSKQAEDCPQNSKIGTFTVKTALLGEIDATTNKYELDGEGNPISRVLEGSAYLAKPFDNPFGSLLAIYLTIDDPKSGTIAKFAGEVKADPKTGQLTTTVSEGPDLPIEDIALHLFKGAAAPLTTPIACGAHTTETDLAPWSAPEAPDAHPSDSFQTTAFPNGSNCPSSEAAAQNKPSFQAGTIAPQAGAFSPFVLRLSREDGSQRFAGIEAILPKGLAAKFAGVPYCSEAQINQAKSREKPNMGVLEQNDPSCPSSSQVGVVDVASGSGPTPIHTEGHAYLAGPYKGAPLSMVIITPAIAGPFDLGAVLNRTALYVNPETAQGHAVSDPLPQIIEGIPLDVRSIVVKLGRPNFTLNPTSCDPMSVIGSALSSLGQSASLTNPFQVGGCQQLPFKPKLSLRLKGGTKRASHPKLIASLKAKPGEANIASAQVKLPPSAFLDQAHIRTICTRVQFAADACPKGSIYGEATATTPLLDQPLSGNVYLRSSNHKLPDLVVALKGPASLPIEIDLAGKTDSVKGSLRNTFEAIPDAPVSTFRLELFGGKRGLVVNSRNLCAHAYKAEVNLTGQNGKAFDTAPVVKSDCKGSKAKRRKGR